MNLIKKQKPIILPHWVDLKKLNPPFSRELKMFKGKERKLLVELLEPLTTPLKAAGGTVVGFLPPLVKNILSSPVLYGYFGFMFIWFLFERISFLRRFNAIKYGYMDNIKEQMAHKARIWANEEKKYVQEKKDAQFEI